MAHVLVCSLPNPGHFQPMHTVARHLKAVGHSVTVYTADTFRAKVEASGLEFFSLSGKANYDYRDPDQFIPNINSLPPGQQRMDLSNRGIFINTMVDQHRGLDEILRTRPIDLILVDTGFFGIMPLLLGPKNQRPPVICCGVNPVLYAGADAGPEAPLATTKAQQEVVDRANAEFRSVFRQLEDGINEKLRQLGSSELTGPPFNSFYTLPDLVLQFSTQEFEFIASDLPPHVRMIGPILPTATGEFKEPSWWNELNRARRVVLVTQGTTANTDLTELIEPTMKALAAEDVLVIAATGKHDQKISFVPGNARVTPFVPFDHLLPKVDLFITNGGFGAVSQALAAGVPVVTAGVTEDKAFVSERVAQSGIGLSLKTSRPSEEQIHAAVLQILSNPGYRERAVVLSEVIKRHNALNAIAESVESLVHETSNVELSA